jgi:DNA-binding response OmpR family regulator
VIRAARKQTYNPATAILTAYPSLGSDWHSHGAESLLVKPMSANDLLRQIEALLVQHEDDKQAHTNALKATAATREGGASRAKKII